MAGSMARARRVPAPPATVSRAALLVDGSDAEFRGLIHDLIAYGHRLDACRDAFARIAGISGVQYEILMLVSRAHSNVEISTDAIRYNGATIARSKMTRMKNTMRMVARTMNFMSSL